MKARKEFWYLLVAILCISGVAKTAVFDVATWLGSGSRYNTTEFTIQAPAAGSAAAFLPGTTNTNPLGSTSARFSNVFSTLLNVSGASTLGTVAASTMTFTIQQSTAPRSTNSAVALVPSGIAVLAWNSTDNELCISTGVTANTWVRVSTPSLACQH